MEVLGKQITFNPANPADMKNFEEGIAILSEKTKETKSAAQIMSDQISLMERFMQKTIPDEYTELGFDVNDFEKCYDCVNAFVNKVKSESERFVGKIKNVSDFTR